MNGTPQPKLFETPHHEVFGDGFTYVIQPEGDRVIKIGSTLDPDWSRVADLQTAQATRLLKHALFGAGRAFELHLHDKLASAGLHVELGGGDEWFYHRPLALHMVLHEVNLHSVDVLLMSQTWRRAIGRIFVLPAGVSRKGVVTHAPAWRVDDRPAPTLNLGGTLGGSIWEAGVDAVAEIPDFDRYGPSVAEAMFVRLSLTPLIVESPPSLCEAAA